MSFDEKRTWIMGVVAVCAYAVYAGVILQRADGGSLADVPYASTMLWSIGAAIGTTILITIVVGMFAPHDRDLKDERDREINRFGDHVGQSFVVIGAVAALLLAMAEADYFWIANAVYLAFVLSATVGAIAKIVAYRRGFQPW